MSTAFATHTDGGAQLDTNPSNTAISTRVGIAFDLLDVDSWVFSLEDIATSLSNLSRFNGHTNFYSVAEHSVRVADLLEPQGPLVQLLGLLHDATEAYLGDVPRPQKGLMTIDGEPFSDFEDTMAYMIFQAYGIMTPKHDIYWAKVKSADYAVYLLEREERPSPGMFAPHGLTPTQAQDVFMGRYEQFTKELE